MDILIAEDETDISFMYKKLLEDRGHSVTLTHDGQECLDVYHDVSTKMRESVNANSHAQPFDVVILDHKMPTMDGLEVAKEIISINPNQRIIVASGFSKDIFEEAAERFHLQIEILQKPFSRTALVDLVEAKITGSK